MARRRTDIAELPATSRQKYGWEEWADGAVWELRQGEDFDCTTSSIVSGAQSYARRHNLRVSIRRPEDGVVLIQFRPDVTVNGKH